MASKRYPYTTTPEDRALFESHLRTWQKKLNLTDWRVEFLEEPVKRVSTADVEISYEHRLAKVRFTDCSRRQYTPEELEGFALHELLHVRLADLIHAVRDEADEKMIEAAEHSVIVLLDKLLRK